MGQINKVALIWSSDRRRPTHIGDEAYSYDDNGNRLSKVRISTASADDKTVEYQWDHRNRLISIVTKNNSGVVTKEVDYEYDVFNRRVSKSIDADGAGPGATEVTRFVYDAFGNVVSETDAAIAFLYGFTGRERDEESGLNYHRARYYETAAG